MLQRINCLLIFSFISWQAGAQIKVAPAPQPAPQPKPGVQAKPAPTGKGQPVINLQPQVQPSVAPPKPIAYKRLNKAVEYSFIVNKPTSPQPKEGDVIKLNMVTVANNRFIYNSFQANKGKPVEFSVNKSGFQGDVIDAITLMSPGDSLICLIDADAIYKNTKNKRPDFIKSGDKIQYFIKLISIKTKEQQQKEQQAAFQKQMKEMQAKAEKEAAKNALKEEKDLKEYFTKNNLQPTKTASGLYYIITEKTDAALPKIGDTVNMNYTGQLLNGKKFDSNTDSTFKHVAPFEFPLGAGRVIKGWDEGVALLPIGSKATFFIPSRLGYGAQGTSGIPANSPLIFDVQLISLKPKN